MTANPAEPFCNDCRVHRLLILIASCRKKNEKPSRSTSETYERTTCQPFANATKDARTERRVRARAVLCHSLLTVHVDVHASFRFDVWPSTDVRGSLVMARGSCGSRFTRGSFGRIGSQLFVMAGDSHNTRGTPPNGRVAVGGDGPQHRPPWYPAARTWAQDEVCARCLHVFDFLVDSYGCCNNVDCWQFRIPNAEKLET